MMRKQGLFETIRDLVAVWRVRGLVSSNLVRFLPSCFDVMIPCHIQRNLLPINNFRRLRSLLIQHFCGVLRLFVRPLLGDNPTPKSRR